MIICKTFFYYFTRSNNTPKYYTPKEEYICSPGWLRRQVILNSDSWPPPIIIVNLLVKEWNIWSPSKQYYWTKTIEDKRTREKFQKVVRASIDFITKHRVVKFTAKCRRYMMTYNSYDGKGDPLTYRMMEYFVKMAKCHCDIVNQDKAFVEKALKEAIMNSVKNWWRLEVITVDIILTNIDVSHQDSIFLLWLSNQYFYAT